MSTSDLINKVHANFARIYLGGIPSLLNDDGAFLSFICVLTATEALGGFLNPAPETALGLRSLSKTTSAIHTLHRLMLFGS
jgi:hypothetical protein